MKSLLSRALATALLCAFGASAGACAAERSAVDVGDPTRFVAAARSAHADADAALARDDVDAARAALERPLLQRVPRDLPAQHARVVLMDLHYRLAEVELRAGRPRDAERWADAGLAHGREADLFTANLLLSRGRARQALDREPEAAGDFYEALRINDDLLRRTLNPREER